MHHAYIALGGNLGNVKQSFDKACDMLSEYCQIIRKSRLYLTPAVGPLFQGSPQPDYLNAAIYVSTSLSAGQLLDKLHHIEHLLGRTREQRWGARTIDLDLLSYENQVCLTPELTLPHPRIAERLFVLQPLADLQAGWKHPVSGENLEQLIQAITATGTDLFEGKAWT